MTELPASEASPALPRAHVEPARRGSWAWVLPVLSLTLAVFLAFQAWGGRGTLIVVRAMDGHGIRPGAVLRYRGIQVGTLEDVRMSSSLRDVELHVRLDRGAADLARAGSRFWIVRPVLSLDTVVGLETVVGARYLAVEPGLSGARRQRSFVALEEPPVPERLELGGLEITLEAPTRFSLAPGAPLTYREIQIGTALSVGLSSDATAVEVRVYVRPPYVQLVRSNSRFWESGGIELGLSLTGGVQLDVGSLRSMLVGGIGVATPDEPGESVFRGHRFVLHPEPEEDWLEWSPPLPVGASLLPPEATKPRLLRATLSWKRGRFLKRSRERVGWVLPVAQGLLGPADLLTADDDALAGTSVLQVEGAAHTLVDPPEWSRGGLARRPIVLEGMLPWDLAGARPAGEETEECLLFGDPARPPMALAAQRLRATPDGWVIDEGVGLDPTWNGACVLAREDGALIGILLVTDDGARVAPVAGPGDE